VIPNAKDIRFNKFRENAERVWLQDLIDKGVDTAISYAEIVQEFEVVIAYYGDTPGYPKGFIAVEGEGFYLVIGNQEYTASNSEELIFLERELFDWMLGEEMISL
jgi:hypothetical protein